MPQDQRRAECLLSSDIGRRTRVTRNGTVIEGPIDSITITHGEHTILSYDGTPVRALSSVTIRLQAASDEFTFYGDETIVFTD